MHATCWKRQISHRAAHLYVLAAPFQLVNFPAAGVRIVILLAEAGLDGAGFLLAGVFCSGRCSILRSAALLGLAKSRAHDRRLCCAPTSS